MIRNVSGKCPHCAREGLDRNRADCYAHCHQVQSGVHVPDLSSAAAAKETVEPSGVVLDFNCSHCGISGSVRVAAVDIVWE